MRDETGNRYGRLTALCYDHTRKGHVYWKCACDCGCVTVVEAGALRSGRTRSCGCFREDTRGDRNRTHGESAHNRLYNIWIGIRQRCNNESYKLYKWYGGKGVKLCDEWNDYTKFRDWAYAHGYEDPKPGQTKGDMMSIDRIDPDKAYSPDNCRWISLRENVSYMRKGKPIRGEVASKVQQPQRIEGEKI